MFLFTQGGEWTFGITLAQFLNLFCDIAHAVAIITQGWVEIHLKCETMIYFSLVNQRS